MRQTRTSENPVKSALRKGPTGRHPMERTRQFMLRVGKSNCCQLLLIHDDRFTRFIGQSRHAACNCTQPVESGTPPKFQ